MFTCDSWFKTQQFASNWVSWHSGEDLLLHIRLESKPLFHTTKGELNWNQLYLVDLRQFLLHGTAFKAAVASPSCVCLPGISTLSKSHSLNHFKRPKCLNVPSTMEELSAVSIRIGRYAQFIEVLYETKMIHADNYLISCLAGCLKT